ncbi:MAG: acyl-CoA synthetase [Candidatus Pelagibacter sp. TMED142]|nr:MAG: acyl-CoA synthetase [Candidatus Pelagibacter sp. TMED142]
MSENQKNMYDVFKKNDANYVQLSPLSFLPRVANIFPNKDAVIYGERKYSWKNVYDRCRQLASSLQLKGIKKGDTVSVIAANTPEMIEAHYGIAMIGAVLNSINIRLDANTIAYILEHSEAKILITDTGFYPSVKKAIEILGKKDLIIIDIVDLQSDADKTQLGKMNYEELLSTGDPNFNWSLPDDEWDALSLNYTSGTSGKPKGVVYHHRGSYIMTMGTVCDWHLPMHPKYLYTVPLFHCNGWGHAWSITACAGTIICCRQVSAKAVYDAIADHGVTHLGGAPIVLGMILNANEQDRRPFNKTVEVMTAGAPPPAAILEGIEKLGFNVTQVYGLTETYGHVLMCVWNNDWDNKEFGERANIKARQGVTMTCNESLRVVDVNTREDVPRDGNTLGEIVLKGNTVMKGYLKNIDATEESFKGGWYRSGDLAVMHENGYVEIKDRLKDIIISGGENISSIEIEGALHRHPSVAIAAVIAKPHEKWGEVPCAFVELKPDTKLTEDELIEFSKQHLANFKRPKEIIFCEIPKTATGKLQKFELRKQLTN